jgi:hypothetical protein
VVNKKRRYFTGILTIIVLATGLAAAQDQTAGAASSSTPYKPQFPGDPAQSESEAQALGYMRVVLRAEREYKKRHSKFTDSLESLAGTGSFTKRMAHSTDRGDYTVGFRPHHDNHPHDSHADDHDGFVLAMTPKHLDSEHRSFYAEDDGVIHADDSKPADEDSPKVK